MEETKNGTVWIDWYIGNNLLGEEYMVKSVFRDYQKNESNPFSSNTFTIIKNDGLPPGDINGDGKINVTDVQCIVMTIGWETNEKVDDAPKCLKEKNPDYADVDCNEKINETDKKIVEKIALKNPLGIEIDSDQNNIADSCENY